MRRAFIFMLLCVITAPVLGAVATNDIRFNTVRPEEQLVRLLRDKFGTVNTDIANSGSNIGASDVWYVDTVNGSATGTGQTATTAVNTLDAAVNLAGVGDKIYILENSSEAVGAAADDVDIDVDGLWIEGLGTGSDMAQFDYTSDVAGSFAIGADNITLVNLRFHANVPDVNEAIEIEAGSVGWTIANCIFDTETEGTDEFFRCISSLAAANDQGSVIGSQFRMAGGAAQAAIAFRDVDYAIIIDNLFSGDYSVADVNNATTASNHILIENNRVYNGTIGGTAGLNAQPGIELVATTSGIIRNNLVVCNVATSDLSIVAADCFLSGNVYTETEGTSTTLNYALPRYIACATADFTASADDVFLVAGGPIEIVSFFGICTTVAAGSPGDLKIHCDATTTDQDRDFSTTVTVDTLAAGDSVKFTNAIDEGVLNFTANTGAGQTLSWICPIGTIETLLTSTGTGACTWYMVYRPLTSSSAVTAAP